MAKASAPSRQLSTPGRSSRPHAHRGEAAPLGPALKQAVEQGQAFGEAHGVRNETESLGRRLKRLA